MRLLLRGGTAAAITVVGLLAGCRSYEARPLDPVAHRDAWLSRSPDSESVRDFAARLATADTPRPFDLADGLDAAEAEVVALLYNPRLRRARARAGVALAAAEHAGAWNDPTLGFDLLRFIDSVPDPWIIGAGISVTLPLSGRLDVERARSEVKHATALLEILDLEWQVRCDVRAAWIRHSDLVVRRDELDAYLAEFDDIVVIAEALGAVGELDRPEAALFAIERATRRIERLALEREIDASGSDVRELLGLAPHAPLDIRASVAPIGAITPVTGDVHDLAGASPPLQTLRSRYEEAERTLELEIRKQYPDLTIGPAYELEDDQSRIGISVALPIPIFNANRGGIARAEAARDLARVEVEVEHERIAGALHASRDRLAAHERERDEIQRSIAPLIDEQIRDARRLLDAGEGTALVLMETLTRAHQTRLLLLDTTTRVALAHTSLQRLAGPRPPETTP